MWVWGVHPCLCIPGPQEGIRWQLEEQWREMPSLHQRQWQLSFVPERVIPDSSAAVFLPPGSVHLPQSRRTPRDTLIVNNFHNPQYQLLSQQPTPHKL